MEMDKQPKIEASKQFEVPIEKLFKAWSDPEQLKKWWRPMGSQLIEVTNELKVGGNLQYVFDKNTFTISGKYEVVKENEKLVYSWSWEFSENPEANANYKLSITFSSKDNGSEIRVVQEDMKNDENLHPNQEGWEKGLSDLEHFLQGSEQQNGGETNTSIPEEAGYRESPDQLKVGGG